MPPATTRTDTPRLLGLLQALADEKRMAVVEALRDGEHCVCDLQEVVGTSQSLLSHHLRVLRDAGLVSDRREGRWVHYSLVPGVFSELEDFLGTVRGDAAASLSGSRCCE
jgi:ArsR family transcriptional regulator